jgi:hypothetical protein
MERFTNHRLVTALAGDKHHTALRTALGTSTTPVPGMHSFVNMTKPPTAIHDPTDMPDVAVLDLSI